jgi:hypothetical protein
MAKCPNNRKTSGLTVGNDQQSSSKRPNWGSLSGLAKLEGCSERTVREWCKKGLIQEAYQTPGGHWRISKPLSWKTRVFLAKRRGEWPFKNRTNECVAEDYQMAEWLLLAQLCQQGLLKELPVPTLADADEVIAEPGNEKAKEARRIQEEIIRRLKNKEPFWDCLLIGWVYQWVNHCSQENPPCPTITQVAKLMGLSRPAFYRRYPNAEQDIAKAYEIAGGKLKEELADLRGRDPVLKQNMEAKKPGIESLHYDPCSDNERTASPWLA